MINKYLQQRIIILLSLLLLLFYVVYTKYNIMFYTIFILYIYKYPREDYIVISIALNDYNLHLVYYIPNILPLLYDDNNRLI